MAKSVAKKRKNKNCELPKCKRKHDGTYGSGRFCRQKCARSFSTKKNRKKISKKTAKTLRLVRDPKICQYDKCGKSFVPRRKHQICCNIKCARKRNVAIAKEAGKNIDFSTIIRKQYADGTRKPSGGNTKKYKYKNITVSGKYELRTCHILDSLKSKNKIIDWEYTDDRIPYIDPEGGNRTYFPDFKVYDSLGYFYVEVKGIVRDNDPIKWLGALLHGHRLVVWFEKTLLEYEKDVIFKVKV